MSTDTEQQISGGVHGPDNDHARPADESNVPPRARVQLAAVGQRASGVLDGVWRDWRIGAVVLVAASTGWGWLAGLWTPRGPLTARHAIVSILVSLVIGGVAGLLTRSRWSLLVGPVVFATVFELTRIGTDGPTVDSIGMSTYGILALVVGRVFHASVSLAPMAFGTIVGAGAARQLGRSPEHFTGHRRWPLLVRRGIAVFAAIGLAVFSFVLVRPGSTDAIVDADGELVVGSIAELETADINGHDLTMMIRGHDITNPVLLFLAGGPGGSEFGAMRNHLPELEEHFTVVTWDQRGAGTSYDQLDPVDTYSLESAIADTIAVTDHVRVRFDQDHIYLVGQSWGTILGVLAAQQHPELFTAFVGTGQMVDVRETDTIFYDDTLAWAQATGDSGLVDELNEIGPPPYAEMLDYETALSHEHEVYPYDHAPNSEGEGGFSENFLVSEYTLIDKVHLLGAFMDTFSVMYPQLQDIDFRRTVTDFEIPVFFVQGAHEADGRAEPFEQWYPMIDAPAKDLVVLDTSGHRPLWEQPHEFVDYMVNTVLDGTSTTDE